MLTAAIEQQRRGRSLQEDARVTNFWNAYWQIAQQDYLDVEAPPPGKRGIRSGWINFPPHARVGHWSTSSIRGRSTWL